jgi:hypothetical protein
MTESVCSTGPSTLGGVVHSVHQLLANGTPGDRIVAMPVTIRPARPLFDFHDIEAISRFSPAKHLVTIRLSFFGKSLDLPTYLDSDGYYDFASIKRLHQGGATVIASQICDFSGSVYCLKLQLEQQLHCHVGINYYQTPTNCQGLGKHVDSHSVIIIQLQGRKRWQLFERAALSGSEYTMDGFTQVDPSQERTLSPGDMLYIPAGFVHAAKSEESMSAHLTVGFNPPTWRDLLDAWVASAAKTDPTLNAVFPPRALRAPPHEEFPRSAEQLLRSVAATPFAEAARRVANYTGNESYPDFEPGEGDIVPETLTPETFLRKTPETTRLVFAGVLRLRHKSGRLLELRPECTRTWAEIDRRSIFRPRDLAGTLAEGKETLFCYYLLSNGFLTLSDSSPGLELIGNPT